jgi:hypothetical protein
MTFLEQIEAAHMGHPAPPNDTPLKMLPVKAPPPIRGKRTAIPRGRDDVPHNGTTKRTLDFDDQATTSMLSLRVCWMHSPIVLEWEQSEQFFSLFNWVHDQLSAPDACRIHLTRVSDTGEHTALGHEDSPSRLGWEVGGKYTVEVNVSCM